MTFSSVGVSENVLETWQKNNHTFKKTEYTMKLEVAGKTYYGSANTKKAAKTAVATEAWNILRTGKSLSINLLISRLNISLTFKMFFCRYNDCIKLGDKHYGFC